MGYASKYENDQERLYEAAMSGALSYSSIPQKELDKTRLKFEIDNLKKFLELVHCALGTAKIQIRGLEKQNAELKAEVLASREKVRETISKSQEQIQKVEANRQEEVSSILSDKGKQLESLISELDKFRFAEFKKLYEQKPSNAIPAPSKLATSKVQKGDRPAKAPCAELNPVLPLGFRF